MQSKINTNQDDKMHLGDYMLLLVVVKLQLKVINITVEVEVELEVLIPLLYSLGGNTYIHCQNNY